MIGWWIVISTQTTQTNFPGREYGCLAIVCVTAGCEIGRAEDSLRWVPHHLPSVG